MRLLFFVSGLALASASCSVLFATEGSSPEAADAGVNDGASGGDGGDIGALALVLDQPGTYYLDTTNGILKTPADQQILVENSIETELGDDASSFQLRRMNVESLFIASSSQLRAHGVFGLDLRVTGTVVLEGDIDASSYLGQSFVGPGSDNSDCPGGSELDASPGSEKGGAGGVGGPLESSGGSGGAGLETSQTDSVPAYTWQRALRGGCAGGRGAVRSGDNENSRAVGGAGGGALRIASETSISLSSSSIRASGAGGEGARAGLHGGGGGGGSGGTIWLEAPVVTLANSTLRSNGGGGGEGASECSPGEAGVDGATPSLGTSAAGGDTAPATVTCGQNTFVGDEAGGEGGAGSAGKFGNPGDGLSAPSAQAGGGGGGGGAEGFVIISSPQLTVQGGGIEPPARNADGGAREDN